MTIETRRTELLETMKEKILARLKGEQVVDTAVPGLRIARREIPRQLPGCFNEPLMGVILQGEKQGIMGEQSCSYHRGQCLVVGVDMPGSFRVAKASPQQPFVAIGMKLEPAILARMVAKMPPMPPESGSSPFGVSVEEAGVELLDALSRFLFLLEIPEQIPMLAPIYSQEIHYRLLSGPQGNFLRRLNNHGTHSGQIAHAVLWLRNHCREPFQVEQLAHHVHMATSTFHRHFKEVTGLSPLQFHKQLRLYEAQQLMLAGEENASSAGFAVGYESNTQFTREYKRLFGEPPMRNVNQLQQVARV